jgi:hypothetical protein
MYLTMDDVVEGHSKHVGVTNVNAIPHFFLCFSNLVSPLFHVWCFIVEFEIFLTLLLGYLLVLSNWLLHWCFFFSNLCVQPKLQTSTDFHMKL